jgi:putative membrane protein
MTAFKKGLFLAALAFVFPLSAWCEEGRIIERTDSGTPTTDQQFVSKAIAVNIDEVRAAEMAVKKSENKEVLAFARRMIDDHTKNKDQWLNLAKTMKLAVVAGTDKHGRAEMARLSKLSGAEWNLAYMRSQAKDHDKVISLFETWAKKAENNEVRELANKTLPVLKSHRKEAKEILAKLER